MPSPIASPHQFIVTVESETPGINFGSRPFSKASGFGIKQGYTMVRDGGSKRGEPVPGFPAFDAINVERHYRRDEDAPLIRQILLEMSRGVGAVTAVVAQNPADADLVPIAGEGIKFRCLLAEFIAPESDSEGATGSAVVKYVWEPVELVSG